MGFSLRWSVDTNPSVSCWVVVSRWWNGQLKPGMDDCRSDPFWLLSTLRHHCAAEGGRGKLRVFLIFSLPFRSTPSVIYFINQYPSIKVWGGGVSYRVSHLVLFKLPNQLQINPKSKMQVGNSAVVKILQGLFCHLFLNFEIKYL